MKRFLLIVASLVAACSQPPPEIVDELVLEMNPSGRAPLSGLLTFTTNRPARATLTISDAESSMSVTPENEFATEHELMVLGLRPGRMNTVEIRIEDELGVAGVTHSFEVVTDPLPDGFAPISVTTSRTARMEPGVTLLGVSRQGDDSDVYIVAIDNQGEVIWYLNDIVADEPRRMSNGNLLAVHDPENTRQDLIEFDMLGNIVRRWHAANTKVDPPPESIPVATDTFHHDVLELPWGNILALSTEVRHFDAYPPNENALDERVPMNVIGDVLVEFRPDDGEIIREWKLFDLIDPDRIGYGFELGINAFRSTYENTLDEPAPELHHSNSVHYDEASDTVFVSSRLMSAIFAIELDASELKWILGDPTGWSEPWSDALLEQDGDLEWFYGQHAAEWTPDGTLLLYDNGAWGRAFPPNTQRPTSEGYSRAVEYQIDASRGTVSQIWSFGGPGADRFFAGYLSEADFMPQTGNVLITNGGQIRTNDGGLGATPRDGHAWVSLMEVTRTEPVEKVWEVVIDNPAQGWAAYRAERLPSLYP